MMDAEDIHEFHYEDGHHRKTYRVSFIPVETLEYEYVVEAESEDDAYDAAEEQLQEAIGWDAAKDFQLNDLEEQAS
tara:strand:+ start:412 stop:639 length:228 start_codon:yes stop_codon:yes gene_type:complete